jgi:peptide deformylase
MVKEVLSYPNKILSTPSKEVIAFDDELYTLLDDMYDTMKAKNGVGLAAVQIGILKQVFIINLSKDELYNKEQTLEFINPKIVQSSGEQICQEGCLSVPEIYFDIKRYSDIQVEYHDRFGDKQKHKYNDFMAVAFQHELEHLNGKIFLEHLSILKRKKFEKEWRKLHKAK